MQKNIVDRSLILPIICPPNLQMFAEKSYADRQQNSEIHKSFPTMLHVFTAVTLINGQMNRGRESFNI